MASIEITEENPINVSLGEENTLTSSVSSPETVSVTSTDGWYEKKYEETDPIFEKSPASDITNEDIENWNNKSDFSGDYNDLENKPTIPEVPTKTSDLVNDSGYSKIYYVSTHNNYTYEQIKNLIDDGYEICLKINGLNGQVVFFNNAIANMTRFNSSWIQFTFTWVTESYVYTYYFSNNTWTTSLYRLLEYEPDKDLSTNDFTDEYKSNVDSNTSARHTHSNKSVLDDISSSDITNWNNKSSFSGSYTDLTNKPTIPDELSDLSDDTTHRLVTDTEKTTWSSKQDNLVSGTNIKTINNQSILGSGNITIQGGGGSGDGDMLKSVYDTNDNGIVDNAEKVNNHTVGTDVPSNAVFTDTVYDDTSIRQELNSKADSSDIPTKTSDLTNDSGFITLETDPTVPSWAKQSTKPNYDGSEISVDNSQIINSVFGEVDYSAITNAQNGFETIATQIAVNTDDIEYLKSDKVDKITGKGLSTNDFTTAYKNNVDSNTSARHTHSNKSVLDGISSTDITNWNSKSTFSGNYNDLINKPAIPTNTSDLTNDSGFLTSETDPTVPSWAKQNTKPSYQATEVSVDGSNLEQATTSMVAIRSATETQEALRYISRAVKYNKEDIDTINNTSLPAKQDTLISGTNIKTINSNSLLGSGNISFETIQDISESSVHITDLYSGIYRIEGGTQGCNVYYNSTDYLSVNSMSSAYLIVTEYPDLYTTNNWVFIGNGYPEFCYGYSWNNSGYCYNVTSKETQETITGLLSDLTTTSKANLVSAINELAYDSGWLDANLNGDFSLYATGSVCKYRKVGKTVIINGQVKAKKTLTEGVIFVLPVGFRPAYTMWFVQQGSGTSKWLLMLNPNGNVYAQRYGTTSQVDFTTSYWLPISATFLAG